MYRVLIVDDEELVLDGLERILNKISGVAVAARLHDGGQAKKYLERHAVDAVFSDIRMPLMDGLELAKWLSIYKPECKMVLISAYNDFDYAQRAMACGVKNYLMKPIRHPEVKKVIEQLIEEQDRNRRSMLWKNDLKREIQEFELYNALISGENVSEDKLKKKLYYAEYTIQIGQNLVKEEQLNDSLLIAGWTNIFRWCAPFCILVLTSNKGGVLKYTLLAENKEQFPVVEDLVACGNNLIGLKSEIEQLCCADARGLIKNKPSEIIQEAITDRVIVKAKEYIIQNLSRNISRSDVAAAVHLDSAYFSKYFKKKTGMNFQDYLLETRITKVKEQLSKGKKVQDAAKDAGFLNKRYFNQVFRQYTGYSPSEYRKMMEEL